ncbi:MAG TPA: serine/threonine-protein kinase, partial [Polyangiales bacterium]|nr:serine/threonine-protein kinase [Polyangiales bacterium]
MGSPAARMPSIPLDALIELTELDGLVMENPRATFHARTGSTLIGPGPVRLLQQPSGVAKLPKLGEVLAGKYEVRSLIGRGATSYVMSALHRVFETEVALKFLDPELIDHSEALRRLALQCSNASRLRSDFIVRTFELERLQSGQPFLVMERLVGRDLRTALAAAGRFSLQRSVRLALEACEALATAHALGITHRALKPEQLFLVSDGEHEHLKLLDLGSDQGPHASSHRVPTVNAAGVPLYMSPEQLRGAAEIDARADIWSLGCVLFEMLCGRPLFLHASLAQACAAVLEGPIPALRTLRPEIPVALEELVLRCLEKRAAERFDSVVELAWALFPFAGPDAHVHVARCAQIFEEYGLLSRSRVARASPAQLDLHAAAVDALAPANARSWAPEVASKESTVSEPSEDTLRVAPSPADVAAKTTLRRRLSSAWPTLLTVVLFVLGCVLALHPSPRAAQKRARLAGHTSTAGE